jgi:phosphate transport system protein
MTTEQQTRRHFHDELDTLQKRLVEMAGLVEDLVGRAVKAVLTRDPSSAAEIIAEDSRVDELEVEVDERVVELLALHQPMASDLRQIITSNKVANDLERVGDHAVNIAKAARRLADTQPLPELRELSEMAQITREMLADALASYVTRNAGMARMVCITDDKVDDLRRSLFRILVTHMLEDPKRIGGALELLLISANLERVADLSTNISEDVVFLVEGRTIKHGAGGHKVADGQEDDELT